MIEVELTLLFVASVIFSLLYEWDTNNIPMGILASAFWNIFGLYYLVAGNNFLWSLSLLFHGIGLIYLIRWMVVLVELRSLERYGDTEWDHT